MRHFVRCILAVWLSMVLSYTSNAQSTITPSWLRGGFGSSAMNCIFSPDAKYIVSSGYDQTLKFWDPNTGKTLMVLSGVSALFSHDGQFVATSLNDGSLSIVQLATKSRIFYLYGGVASFCLSSNASRLYTMSADRRIIRVWDVMKNTALFEFPVAGDYSTTMTLTADDSRLVVRGSDRRLYVYDAESGTLRTSVLTHPYAITQMMVSPDSKTVVTASYDQVVKIWSLDSLQLLQQIPSVLNYAAINFSPDGSVMSLMTSDTSLNFFSSSNWKLIRKQKYSSTPLVAFMPDNKRYYMNEGSLVRVYYIVTGELSMEVNTLKKVVSWSRVSNDGKLMVTLHNDSCMRVWHLPEVSLAVEVVGHRARIASLCYSADGKTLNACETTGFLVGYDVKDGSILRTRTFNPRCVTPDATQDLTRCYALNSDSNMLVVGSFCYYRDASNITHYLQNLNFLRIESGEEADAMEYEIPPTMVNGSPVYSYSPLTTIDVSRSMGYVATKGIADQTVGVWNTQLRELRHHVGEHSYGVRSYSLSADGDAVITTSWQEAKVWDVSTGSLLATVSGASDWVDAAAVSRGGRFLAMSSGAEIRVFDLLNGVLYRRFVVDSGSAGLVQFSANGDYLISCNQTFNIWHLPTMQKLAFFDDYLPKPYTSSIGPQVCFSPDSRSFAIGCAEGSIMVFNIGDMVNSAEETDGEAKQLELHVLPQPVVDNATVRLMSPTQQSAQLRVLDVLGNEVQHRDLTLREGLQSIDLSLYHEQSGMYICEVTTSGERLRVPFIVTQ